MMDTDVLSEFLRGNEKVVSKVDEHLKEFGFISLSVITYYEILNGLIYKDAKKQMIRFQKFVKLNKVIPMNTRSAEVSAKIQSELRSKGTPIGHTDTLIAGIAIANKLQLITNNTKHFQRIKGLRISNWSK